MRFSIESFFLLLRLIKNGLNKPAPIYDAVSISFSPCRNSLPSAFPTPLVRKEPLGWQNRIASTPWGSRIPENLRLYLSNLEFLRVIFLILYFLYHFLDITAARTSCGLSEDMTHQNISNIYRQIKYSSSIKIQSFAFSFGKPENLPWAGFPVHSCNVRHRWREVACSRCCWPCWRLHRTSSTDWRASENSLIIKHYKIDLFEVIFCICLSTVFF